MIIASVAEEAYLFNFRRILYIANGKWLVNLLLLLLLQGAILVFPTVARTGASYATQGEFAVKLVEKLGYGKDVPQDKAIKILSSLSIRPGIGPEDKWQKDEPATQKFVTKIQASMQMLLKDSARELSISAPPTLELYVFEVPPAPQRVYFPPDSVLPDSAAKPQITPRGIPSTLPPPPPPPINVPSTAPPDLPPEKARSEGEAHQAMKIGVAMNLPDVLIDDRVFNALTKENWVPVIVDLRPPVAPGSGDHPPEDMKQWADRMQDDVLSTLSADEFRLTDRDEKNFRLKGLISKDGLIRLQADPYVKKIEHVSKKLNTTKN